MNRRDFLTGLTLTGIATQFPVFAQSSSAQRLLKPPALKPGDTVGLVTPASPILKEHLKWIQLQLGQQDLVVKVAPHVMSEYGYLAGTDQQRASDINQMFADPNIKGIIATGGGWGSSRILPLLDYDLIRKNPKIFLGYSDITALLLGLYSQTGLVTFHGLLGTSLWNPYSVSWLKKILTDTLIQDVSNLYHQALEVFAQYEYPFRLSVSLGKETVKLRRKYSQIEPLMLVLVQLQFHYMGRMLLEWMSMKERTVFFLYFKTLEDYLYSPLGEVNDLAGKHLSDSPALIAVQQLLPIFTTIAHQVYRQVQDLNPGYRSISGNLKNHILQYSSTRDIELFQIYLCWCVLENSLRPIQRELFPICVILYPRLHISWKLIQDMLDAMSDELEKRLLPENFAVFSPYLHVLSEIFSDQVVQSV